MSGSLRILPEELPAEKHDHVDLVMSNGKVLRYTDPRRFGAWLWTSVLEGHSVLAHLGLNRSVRNSALSTCWQKARREDRHKALADG